MSTSNVPVRTWDLSEAIKPYLDKPEHKMIRLQCATNVYWRVNQHGRPVLCRRLLNAVFDALQDPVSELMYSGLSLSDVFYQIQKTFDLPDFFTRRHFYSWFEQFFSKKQTVRGKFLERLRRSAEASAGASMPQTVNNRAFSAGAGANAPASAAARPFSQSAAVRPNFSGAAVSAGSGIAGMRAGAVVNGTAQTGAAKAVSAGVQSKAEPVNMLSMISRYGSLEVPSVMQFPLNRTHVLIKAEVLKSGRPWPYDPKAECLILPGEIDADAYSATKAMRDAIDGGVPTPRRLYELEPDDPRYPFDQELILTGGVKFLIDDDGYIYNPYIASVKTSYIPVPITEDFEPRVPGIGAGGVNGMYGLNNPENRLVDVLVRLIATQRGTPWRYHNFRFLNKTKGVLLMPLNDRKRSDN